MILSKEIKREDFYNIFYTTINSFLKLSKTELAILSLFAKIRASLVQSNLSPDQIDATNFSASNRRLVASTLDMSIYNLNNYIKSLKDKKILLTKASRKITIQPSLFPSPNSLEDIYSLEFKFKLV